MDFTQHGYRLPTEAEWEYACRAGTTTDFYWGGSYPPLTASDTAAIDANAVWWHNSPDSTQPVAGKLANAWGLYDMAGNVWQWCNDWYGGYGSSSQSDPTGPSSGTYRVMRGGSWANYDYNLRSADRYVSGYAVPGGWNGDNGFRCVRR
jgi:formylglycine-generating enzyme required for sulfatase activity